MISFIRFIGTYDYWGISRAMRSTIIFVYFFAKWQNDRVIFRQKENIGNREIVQKLTTVREKHFINRYQTFFPFEKEGKVHFNIFESQSYEEPKTTRLAWFKVRAQPRFLKVQKKWSDHFLFKSTFLKSWRTLGCWSDATYFCQKKKNFSKKRKILDFFFLISKYLFWTFYRSRIFENLSVFFTNKGIEFSFDSLSLLSSTERN